jgi:hypothetical protein
MPIQHATVGAELTQAEFEAAALHQILLPGLLYGLIKGATYDRRYTAMDQAVALGTAGVGAAANALRVLPFIPPMDITADRICCNCTTLYSGGKIRLGIYADNGSLYPGARLIDSGDIACDAAGFKDVTISQALAGGTLYWIGYVVNGITTLAFSKIAAGTTPSIMGVSAANPPVVGMGWTVAHTYGALPNPYTAGGTVLTQVTEILVAIRAA